MERTNIRYVTPEDIEKLVKILNEDFEGITPDDIKSSDSLMNQMIFSNNMHYQIDKHIFQKNVIKCYCFRCKISNFTSVILKSHHFEQI